MTADAPQSDSGCPDGGACYHQCITGCWRVAYASPFSNHGPRWSDAERRKYGTVVQAWAGPGPGPVPDKPADFHWGSAQGRILRHLHEYVAAHGYPPTMRELGAAVGLTSTSSVAHHLQVLEHRGHIRRVPNQPRAITLLTPPPEDT